MAGDNRAFVNDHDTVVFEDDIVRRQEETGVSLEDFLAAGYREVTPEDRIYVQAAEHTVVDPTGQSAATFGDLAEAMDRDDASFDLGPGNNEILTYVRRIRDLRAANEKARPRGDEPVIVRKGRGR